MISADRPVGSVPVTVPVIVAVIGRISSCWSAAVRALSAAVAARSGARTATENGFHNNWRSAKPSNPGPSSRSSQSNGERFRRLRTPAHGVISSPLAPHTATLVRFDFCGDETGSAAVRMKKGSCEMRGDGVETQMGDPNAV